MSEFFEYGAGFERGEATGNLRLGKLEGYYEELFAEVIEDGVITTEERARLDRMADNLGLDRARLRKLEQALQAAYEARHNVRITEERDEEALPRSIMPLEPATDQRTLALERRVKYLEARVAELQKELEEARANLAIEVDLSDVAPPAHVPDRTSPAPAGARSTPEDDPAELARRVRHDPRDETTLHALFRSYGKQGDADRALCVADVLAYLGAATLEQKDLLAEKKGSGLIRPTAPLGGEAWTRLLFHPEEEPLIGEIFAVVAPAVLLGRISALRRDKALPKLDAEKKQDPTKSTIQAVRCFSWAAAILGMSSPALYVDPDFSGAAEMVPSVPPAARLGARALSGRSSAELAFLAGRHLACHREEHFVRMLVPRIPDLEEIFLAALSIGNPGLPLAPNVKRLVVPIANAIEPILEPASVDRLRGHFLRFVEEGGRTNLQRWAAAMDKTTARAGLLLAGDLHAARAVFEAEDATRAEEKMTDLLAFTVSDRCAKLRKQIGVAVA
jgi:hypothetical protein